MREGDSACPVCLSRPIVRLAFARNLIRLGLPVFVAPPAPDGIGTGKTGFLIPPGWQATRPDLANLEPWQPDWAVCLVTGHGADVLDVDPRHGGDATYEKVEADGRWPKELTAVGTPSSGFHSFVNSLGIGSTTDALPGIDVRAGRPDGTGRGFVFLPPTQRVSKVDGVPRPYRLLGPDCFELDPDDDSGRAFVELAAAVRRQRHGRDPDDVETPAVEGTPYAELDVEKADRVEGWLVGAIRSTSAKLSAASSWPDGVRNEDGRGWGEPGLRRLLPVRSSRPGLLDALDDGGRLGPSRRRRPRADGSGCRTALEVERPTHEAPAAPWPTRLDAPVDHDDPFAEGAVPPTGSSSTNAQAGQSQNTAQPPPPLGRRLKATAAADITMKAAVWGWHPPEGGRIPAGALTICAGREGTGKLSFGLWMAAQVTRGTLPGHFYGRARYVFIVAVEDSWEHTIRPRLEAAGADPARVFRVEAEVTEDEDRTLTLTLPKDIEFLERGIVDYDVALVILDPLMSVIADCLDTHQNRQTRQALDPLALMAARTGAMVVAIAHFNKSVGTDLSSLISGSGAFKDVARAVLGFVRDKALWVMSQTKNSLGREDLSSYTYSIVGTQVPLPDGTSTSVGRFVLGGFSFESAQDILGRQNGRHTDGDEGDDDRNAAQAWLLEYLKADGRNGEAHAGEVIKAAAGAGFTRDEVKKARARCRNPRIRGPTPGVGQGWRWAIVSQDATQGAQDAGPQVSWHLRHLDWHLGRGLEVLRPTCRACGEPLASSSSTRARSPIALAQPAPGSPGRARASPLYARPHPGRRGDHKPGDSAG